MHSTYQSHIELFTQMCVRLDNESLPNIWSQDPVTHMSTKHFQKKFDFEKAKCEGCGRNTVDGDACMLLLCGEL